MKNASFPAGVKPDISAVLTQANGTKINLQNKDFSYGSVSFKSGTSNSSEFSVGAAIIGEFRFGLMNDKGDFSDVNYVNATIEPKLTYGSITIDMGKYWFVNHKETGSIITCETYDALQILDEHQLYEDQITYPTTIASIVNKIAAARGFTATGMANGAMQVEDPGDDEMTERECIAYLAQMMGQFVVADGNNLHFDWYKPGSKHDAGVTFSHDLRTEPTVITGVKVYPDGSEVDTSEGENGYVVTISDNPFITDDNVATVASIISSAVVGTSFYPGTISILANPAIEAGDVLTVQTDKQTVTVYATTVTYKLQLQESITADSDPYAGDMRLSKAQKLKKIAKKAAEQQIQDDLDNSDSPLSQAISSGGGGSGGGGGLPAGDVSCNIDVADEETDTIERHLVQIKNDEKQFSYIEAQVQKVKSGTAESYQVNIGKPHDTSTEAEEVDLDLHVNMGNEGKDFRALMRQYGTATFSGPNYEDGYAQMVYHQVKRHGISAFEAMAGKRTTGAYKIYASTTRMGDGAVEATTSATVQGEDTPSDSDQLITVRIGKEEAASSQTLMYGTVRVVDALLLRGGDGNTYYRITVDGNGNLQATEVTDAN